MKTLLIISLVVFSFVAMAEPDGLSTLRDTYKGQLAKIGDEEMGALATAQAQYIASLSALEKQFQQAGALEPLLKASKEKERFSSDRDISAEHVSLDVPEIASLQNQYVVFLKTSALGPAQNRLNLAGFYERSLKKLEADLTKMNDISGALAVKGERDALGQRPEIVESQKIVAEWNKTTAASLPKEAPVPEPPAVEKPAAAASVMTGVDKSKVKVAVKARFSKFIDAIEDQDWEDAIEFVDPKYREKTGSEITKDILKMRYSRARMVGDNPAAKIRVKEIEVAEDGKSVKIVPELWAGNKSHSLERMNWIPFGEDWYLSLGGAKMQAGQDGGRDLRPPAKQDWRNKPRPDGPSKWHR